MVAVPSFFYQAGTLIGLRDAIRAAPSLHLEPSGALWSAQARHASEASLRSNATGEGMFEHCEAVHAPLSGNDVVHSPGGYENPAP